MAPRQRMCFACRTSQVQSLVSPIKGSWWYKLLRKTFECPKFWRVQSITTDHTDHIRWTIIIILSPLVAYSTCFQLVAQYKNTWGVPSNYIRPNFITSSTEVKWHSCNTSVRLKLNSSIVFCCLSKSGVMQGKGVTGGVLTCLNRIHVLVNCVIIKTIILKCQPWFTRLAATFVI